MPRCNINTRNDILTALTGTSFGAASVIEAYTGTIPATGETAPTGTLLWSFTMDGTPWGTVASGSVSQADVPLSANASATGTIGYVRVRNSASSRSMYCTATATGGGGEFEFSSLAAVSGSPIQITALSLVTTGIA
jgi:hypothetical protein